MQSRKQKVDDNDPAKNLEKQRKAAKEPKVVIRATAMDRDQAHRLSTAVDALLSEFVRREMGRAKQP